MRTIQKRYQYYSNTGIQWTKWFTVGFGTEQTVANLRKTDKWQLKELNLKNEYQLIL